MAMANKDAKKETVMADVHHPDDGDTSNEEDEEPDHRDSDSSDGETLWYLSSDAKKGTQHAIFGARRGARLQSEIDTDQDDKSEPEELEQELEEIISESDAPTKLMAIDPQVSFKHRQHIVKAAKTLIPPERQPTESSRNLKQKNNVRSTVREHTSRSSQAGQDSQQMPTKYRFVHSNGQVDVVVDDTNRKPARKQIENHSPFARKQHTDSEDYLSASDTEPDDPRMMSQLPVSKQQVKGLRNNVKSRQRQSDNNDNASLPVYYSTNRKQRNSEPEKGHNKHGDKRSSKQPMSTLNRGCDKGNGSTDGSYDSDSDGS